MCATTLFAQSTQPAAVPQGKYEQDLISQTGATPGSQANSVRPMDLSNSGQIETGRVLLALGMVLGLILAMRWAGKKYFPSVGVPRSGGAMKILSRLAIAPKQQLLMIQVGRRIVIVGDAGGQMSPLSEITDPDEAAHLIGQIAEEKSNTSLKAFGSLFHRAEETLEEKFEESEQTPAAMPDSTPAADPAIEATRGEIDELSDKLRLLSAQFSGK
jgi:flagellar biogenesis protein FliO